MFSQISLLIVLIYNHYDRFRLSCLHILFCLHHSIKVNVMFDIFFLEKSFTRFTSFLILWIFTLLYPTSLFWFDEKLLVNFKFIELGKNWYIVKFHWWCCLDFSFCFVLRGFYPVLSYQYHELSYLSYVLLAHV